MTNPLEDSNNLPEQVNNLEASLNRFVDFVLQNQRNQQVQLEFHQSQINELRQAQQEQFRELSYAQQGLVAVMRELAEAQRETFARFDQMQSEIRGLQTENRRILEQLERRLPPEETN